MKQDSLSLTDLSLLVSALRRTAEMHFLPARHLIVAAPAAPMLHEKTRTLCHQAEQFLVGEISKIIPSIDYTDMAYGGETYYPNGLGGSLKGSPASGMSAHRFCAFIDVMDSFWGYVQKDGSYAVSVGIKKDDRVLGVCAYLPTSQQVLIASHLKETWLGKISLNNQMADLPLPSAHLGQAVPPVLAGYVHNETDTTEHYADLVENTWGDAVLGAGPVRPVASLSLGLVALIRHANRVKAMLLQGAFPTARLTNAAFLAQRASLRLLPVAQPAAWDGVSLAVSRHPEELRKIQSHYQRRYAPKTLGQGEG